MKKIGLSLISLALTSSLFAYTKGKTYKITVLHTNDHHGRFWENKDGELGLAARATLLKQLRKEIENEGAYTLLLDAGDVNTGIPQSDVQEAEPDFLGMSQLGYDVMALGNHEFDNPVATIKKQQKWAGFPFISANIYDAKTGKRIFDSHIVKSFDDLKITIFGLTTEDTPLKTNKINTEGLNFRSAVKEAKRIVPKLRKETDILIALTHVGHHANESHGADAPGDVTIARQTKGIDLIVGGHTQKPLFEPDIQNGTIIVQAYEWGKYIGRVDLEFKDGKLTLKKSQLIPVNLKDSKVKISQDEKMLAFLKPFKEKGDAIMAKMNKGGTSAKKEMGTADIEFIGSRDIVRNNETNLGNLIATSMKEKLKADIGIMNSGGIRDSIAPGTITYETIMTVLPFKSEIVTAELKGNALRKYLEFLVFNLTAGSGSFPQFSGVEIIADKTKSKITSLKVNGKSLSNRRTYRIALPEFIANGGDKYPKLDYKKHGFIDADVLSEYITKIKTLKGKNYAPQNDVKFE